MATFEPRTFYIAGSLKDYKKIKALRNKLPEDWDWSFNWTLMKDEDTAEQCLRGAVEADVFIFVRKEDVSMRTAHGELGARLASGKLAYVIAETDCLLYTHKNVVRVYTFNAALNYLDI